MAVLAPGTTIQRYVVEARIGTGGMGSVYRARDTQLDRPVALKVLATEPGGSSDTEREARDRLVREARAVAALSHPNAVTIYDAGDSEYGPFIVMELVEGETLREAIRKPAPVSDVVGWMKMAALALGEAHDRGIVHRDVKPENLMVRRDGIVKVLDFGIARAAKRPLDPTGATEAALPTLTGTGIQIGTPQYMAPEQIKGKKLDGRADQFAWGVTAFEALTGRLPWETDGGALGVVAAILEEEPPPLSSLRPDVPARVSDAIARAMSKRPEARFASMRDLVAALDGVVVSDAGSVPLPSPARALPPETRFGEGTMKAVIGRALELQEKDGYSKSDVRDAAREIGISESALEEATAALRADRKRAFDGEEIEAIAERVRRRRRRGFVNHLIPYIGVNMILLLIPLARGMYDKAWAFLIPAIAWGIALAIHGLAAFSREVEPRDIEKQIRRDQRGSRREDARARRRDRRERREPGPSASVPGEPRAARMRVAAQASNTARAEVEAEAEDEADVEAEAEAKAPARR